MITATARVRALERYRQPVEGPLAFIRDQVVLPTGQRVGDVVGGDSWIERDLLRPVFERDADGLPRYRLAYIEVARGHWKTGGAGAVAIAEAVLHDSTDVVVCAGDRDQAAIALEAIDGYLRRDSELARSFRRRSDVAEVEARGSRIRVVSSNDPSAVHVMRPDGSDDGLCPANGLTHGVGIGRLTASTCCSSLGAMTSERSTSSKEADGSPERLRMTASLQTTISPWRHGRRMASRLHFFATRASKWEHRPAGPVTG